MEDVKTRRAEYAEQTRTAVLDAAARAFAEHGFAKASVTGIATTARVTKGAVYHHFAGKQNLFEAVFDRYNEAAQRRVYDAFANHPVDPWQAALAGLDATLDVGMDPVAARLIYIEGPVGLGRDRWRDSEDRYTRRNVRRLLQSLVEAGVYPDDLPMDATSELVTAMVTRIGVALAEAPSRQRQAVRDELRLALHRLMTGLGRQT